MLVLQTAQKAFTTEITEATEELKSIVSVRTAFSVGMNTR
jgi:hypothetical protein